MVQTCFSQCCHAPCTTRSLSSRDNVFYFDGWDGLGASAVLRAIARRLTASSPDDQVIHIEYCSMWESRRSLQRAVAEQLRLPDQVMELFDRQDEEDDYQGVPQGSRAGLEQVTREIYQHVLQQQMKHRFFVIFHNGSNEEIDLASLCGFTLSGYSTNKVLWTFQGRFRLKPRAEIDTAVNSTGTTDTFISASSRYEGRVPQAQFWSYLVQKEASEVAETCKINTGPSGVIVQPEQVAECFLYFGVML